MPCLPSSLAKSLIEQTCASRIPIITIEHLRSQFGHGDHDDLNLEILRGEIFSIVGGSGSGKTVLMRQMLGRMPKQGVIRVFGDNIHEPKEHHLEHLRRRSGMLFQHGALYSALNVIRTSCNRYANSAR